MNLNTTDFRVVGLIQARMSSSRLPGKVLMDNGGAPFLELQLNLLQSSNRVSDWVVLTSTEESDDGIEDLCRSLGVKVFRGDLLDVFGRFQGFLNEGGNNYTNFVRITADCPLICVEVLDKTVDMALNEKLDYASNTLKPTFPDGFDVEVVKVSTFQSLARESLTDYEIEHVTPVLYLRRELNLSLGCLVSQFDYSSIRVTLDTPEDAFFLGSLWKSHHDKILKASFSDLISLITKQRGVPKTQKRAPITKLAFKEYLLHL